MKNLIGIVVVIVSTCICLSSCNNAQRDWPADEVKVGKVKADTAGVAMQKAKLKERPTAQLNREPVDSSLALKER